MDEILVERRNDGWGGFIPCRAALPDGVTYVRHGVPGYALRVDEDGRQAIIPVPRLRAEQPDVYKLLFPHE